MASPTTSAVVTVERARVSGTAGTTWSAHTIPVNAMTIPNNRSVITPNLISFKIFTPTEMEDSIKMPPDNLFFVCLENKVSLFLLIDCFVMRNTPIGRAHNILLFEKS